MKPYIDMKKATEAFTQGVNYLAKLTKVPKRQIVLAEAGSILKACAADTKVAAADDVERGATVRALRGAGLTRGGQITINAGVRGPYGRVFLKKKGGRVGGGISGYRRTHNEGFKPINQHYADSDWEALKAAVTLAKAKVARARAKAAPSAALARGSWVRTADAAGIRLEDVPGGRLSPSAIGKARAASARGGAERNNGAAVLADRPGSFFVTIINRYPGGSRLKFESLLAAKISGRALFMAKSLQKGFDGSAKDMVKLFPGWTVKPGSS